MVNNITRLMTTDSPDATVALAADMAKRLRGGEVIELVSDLGGGKTTFVNGLSKGINSSDLVHSPSFTLANKYRGERLTIYHLDLYRLNYIGLMADEINEFIGRADVVTVIEWPGLIEDFLPTQRLSIKFQPMSEMERQLTFTFTSQLKYLISDIV
jgi:tRNA threonylcarbamoyladenosine biosynthesis protein TsaE